MSLKLISGQALSAEQLAKLDEIRIWCSEQTSPGFEQARHLHWLSDECLRRHLVAVRWDMKKVRTELTATTEWRHSIGVAGISAAVPELADPMRSMYMYWNGYDPFGRPLMYVRMRRHNADIPRNNRIQFFLYMFELGTRLMAKQFSGFDGVEQWIIIMDEKDKKSKNNDMKFLSALAGPMFHHYVERLHAVFVLQPSMSFSLGLKVASTFIDDQTKAKIKVIEKPNKVAGQPHPTIAAAIPAHLLEVEYSGTAPELTFEQFTSRAAAVDADAVRQGIAGGAPGAIGDLADAGADIPDEEVA